MAASAVVRVADRRPCNSFTIDCAGMILCMLHAICCTYISQPRQAVFLNSQARFLSTISRPSSALHRSRTGNNDNHQ